MSIDRRVALALSVMSAVWVIHVLLLAGPLEDDSFISYRYASHIANGHGPVFNEGERVEGYTNFLWTLLAAVGVGLFHVGPIEWSVVSGILLGLATTALLFFLSRRFLRDWNALLPPCSSLSTPRSSIPTSMEWRRAYSPSG